MTNTRFTAKEIRQSFLDYFRGLDHAIVPSAPLLPADDPTLYFTNAGMNQFKDVFLGSGTRDYKRAADTQKCMRVSGKHNDLEDVGKDHYHHTFFEMLGNWSFGDYYKDEAIEWAWRLLTEVWGLPPERLHATVFTEDDEAYEIWRKYVVDERYISRHGHKDNFWEMGETGPCGPCSEIHYDLGEDFRSVEDSRPNVDDERFREVWNNVFIQYERQADGSLEPLPARHVDTGMGLERVVAILQGKFSHYETDLFTPYIDWVAKESAVAYDPGEKGIAHRVIADHLRATAFSIADGIIPSNEGRGYVVRRILRRAARYGRTLGLEEPFLYRMVPVLIDTMGEAFPEIAERQQPVTDMLRSEEERFSASLERGLKLFEEEAAELRASGETRIPGATVFDLYSTHGFPMDLTRLLAEERGMEIDEPAFERLLEEFKDTTREASAQFQADDVANKAAEAHPPTEFLGHDTLCAEAVVLGVTQIPEADGEVYLVTDRTPCYAEAGGQVADEATLRGEGFCGRLVHCSKVGDVLLHRVRCEEGRLAVGGTVELEVDPGSRVRTACNHTATHLLHAALHQVLGDHATQAGSLVAPARLRFDFVHPKPVTPEELRRVEEIVNRQIERDAALEVAQMSRQEADERGAMAMFGEKYGERVRVVEVPGFSAELCGGTHVDRTGRIQRFRILSESSVAANVRRIEALAGPALLEQLSERAAELEALASTLNVSPEDVPQRIEGLKAEVKKLRKHLAAARKQGAGLDPSRLAREAWEVPGKDFRLATAAAEELSVEDLRNISDAVIRELGKGVVVLATTNGGKVNFVCKVARELADEGSVHAGELIMQVASVAGGGGGGKPHMATAGARDPSKVPDALEEARRALSG